MDADKERFISALAKFLVDNEAHKSILAESSNSLAREWADLRNTTPLFGYYGGRKGLKKAKAKLSEFLK